MTTATTTVKVTATQAEKDSDVWLVTSEDDSRFDATAVKWLGGWFLYPKSGGKHQEGRELDLAVAALGRKLGEVAVSLVEIPCA
jgi:hypothetical protein